MSLGVIASITGINRNPLSIGNKALFEESTLTEDFSNPSYAAGVLHTADGETYVDLDFSDADLVGNSIAMAADSVATSAVKSVTKLNLSFTGDIVVSYGTVANRYDVAEDLTSGATLSLIFAANYIKFTAGESGAAISNIVYSYLCETATTYLTAPITVANEQGGANVPIESNEVYNYATSGVPHDVIKASKNYSISFAIKTNLNAYNNSAVYFGANLEVFFQLRFTVWNESAETPAVVLSGTGCYINIFKWGSTYVGSRLSNSGNIIDYKGAAGETLSTPIFQDMSTEHGARMVYDFDEQGYVTSYYNNGGVMTQLAKSSKPLNYFNGKNGNIYDIRSIDFHTRAGADSGLVSTLSDFQIAYGFHGGTGKLVKV